MKLKPNKKRLKEIQEVYRSLGLESEEVRKYLAALATLPGQTQQEHPIVFIEAGATSYSHGELEPDWNQPLNEIKATLEKERARLNDERAELVHIPY